MIHRLFAIADLDAGDVHFSSAGDTFQCGGESFTVVTTEEGSARRWTRTDRVIVKDAGGRYWALPCEVNPTDHDGGAEGFRSHLQHPERTHVKAYEVRPREVTTITWETIK